MLRLVYKSHQSEPIRLQATRIDNLTSDLKIVLINQRTAVVLPEGALSLSLPRHPLPEGALTLPLPPLPRGSAVFAPTTPAPKKRCLCPCHLLPEGALSLSLPPPLRGSVVFAPNPIKLNNRMAYGEHGA